MINASSDLSYRQLMHLRWLKRFPTRPWGFGALFQKGRRIRLLMGLVMAIACVLAFIFSSPCPSGREVLLHPGLFVLRSLAWALGAAILPTFISGIRGFVRWLGSALVVNFCFYFVIFSIEKANGLWFLLPLAMLWICIWLLLAERNYERMEVLYPYNRAGKTYAVSMDLADFLPLIAFSECFVFQCVLPQEADDEDLEDFLLQMNWRADTAHVIFAGYIYDETRNHICLAFYGRDVQPLSQLLSRLKFQEASSRISHDPDWEFYQKELYPETNLLFHLIHVNLLSTMNQNSESTAEEKTLHYLLALPDEQARQTVLTELTAAHLQYDLSDRLPAGLPPMPKDQISLILTVRVPMELEKLDATAEILHKFAKKHGGKLVDFLLDEGD